MYRFPVPFLELWSTLPSACYLLLIPDLKCNKNSLMHVVQATVAAIMPACSAAAVKAYLLRAADRPALAAEMGASFRTVAGAAALRPLLADRAFLCLHYRLKDGQLVPCTEAPAAQPPAAAAPLPAACGGVQAAAAGPVRTPRLGVQDSNVQIGILLRRGVGGTSPARAVRSLSCMEMASSSSETC
jgi:hypothetical protein